MNALLDKDFVFGFVAGVGIAVAIKLFKDLVTWIRDRKGKGTLTVAIYKAALRRLAAILFFLKLSKVRSKTQEVYDLDSGAENTTDEC